MLEIKEYILYYNHPNDKVRVVTLVAIADGTDNVIKKDTHTNRRWVINALYLFIFSIFSPDFSNYRATVDKLASRYGDDTDTNAAIAGAICGAYHGMLELRRDPINRYNLDLLIKTNPKFLVPDSSLVIGLLHYLPELKLESPNYAVLICGSRSISETDENYEKLKTAVRESNFRVTEIITGGAKGADKLGERYAVEMGIRSKVINPEWSQGKHAELLRNSKMIKEVSAVIALWDGISAGTQDTMKKAEEMKLPLFMVKM